jgi:hypothetical protein
VAYKLLASEDHAVTLVTDALYPNNNDNYLNVGGEYGLWGKMFIRGGYRGLFMPDREGGLNVGGGVYLFSIKVDYAYSDMGRLSSIHRISASVVF